MKRFVILALSALLLIGALSACSASGYVGDPYYGDGYSNVSTTRDGTINGTNPGYREGYGYGYQGTYHNGTTGTNGAGAGVTITPNGTGRTTTGGAARSATGSANTYTGTTSGTGMAGGR